MPDTDITQIQRDLIADFAVFDNWLDRYQYLIDLGRQPLIFIKELGLEAHLSPTRSNGLHMMLNAIIRNAAAAEGTPH